MDKKDELIDLLRDRLGDLEASVDPALWQGIQGRMAEAMIANGTDPVTELFRNGLQGAEAPVDPGVWAGISSQLGHSVTTGGSLATWIGGGLAAVVVVGGLWLGLSRSEEVRADVAEVKPVVTAPVNVPSVEEPALTIPTGEVVGEEKQVQDLRGSAQKKTAVATVATEQPVKSGTMDEVVEPASNSATGAVEVKPEMPGPFIDKVNAIIEKAEERIAADPRPAEEGDTQVPASGNPEPEPVEEAEPVLETNTAIGTTQLFIPNVFTPNEDGVNDVFEVSAVGLTSISVSIYSAANDKLVFRADDLAPWDGRDANGVRCAEGYYFYAIEAIGPDGKPMSKGQVLLLNIR